MIFVYDGEWTEDSQSGQRRLGRGDVLFQPGGGTSVVIMKVSPTILAGFCGLYGFYPRSILTSFDDVEGIPERIRAEMERADEATTGGVLARAATPGGRIARTALVGANRSAVA